MSAIVEAHPAPAAELRTSLGLASLAAALIHVMSAVHDGAVVAELVAAGILAVVAALLAFSRTQSVLGPAVGFTTVLTIGLPNLLAAAPQVILAGGALALLWGRSDRALLRWSRPAFAVFAIAAITGFGHLAH